MTIDQNTINQRVLSELQRGTTQITVHELASWVFADEIDGGPDTADQAIRRSIYSLREAGHRIVARSGRLGGYIYVGFDDPSKTSIKATRERRAQVKVLAEMGRTLPHIVRRLGLPKRIVAADLRAIGQGRTA